MTPKSVTLNDLERLERRNSKQPLFGVILPNSAALEAHYVKVVIITVIDRNVIHRI